MRIIACHPDSSRRVSKKRNCAVFGLLGAVFIYGIIPLTQRDYILHHHTPLDR
jgi:hypothetical protein